MSGREILLPLITIIGALSFASAIMFAVFTPSGAQECGSLYNPCMRFGKWTMVAIMAAPAIGWSIAAVVLAWARATRGE